MKKNLSKICVLILALVVLIAVQPAFALAEELNTETSSDAVVAIINDGTTTYEYATLEAALADAYPLDNVILIANYALTNTSVVIPANVQVTIPTSASYNDTLSGNNISGATLEADPYVTLTVPAGKTLEVNGTLLVAGNQQSSTNNSGCLTGNYGEVIVNGNLTVNDGGKLYARGRINGDGKVTANNGSTVYQLFQIHDWRGGTASLGAYNKGTFPFNLYEFNSIRAKAEYNNGSALIGQAYIYANSTHNTCEVPLIGVNGQLSFDSAASVDSGKIAVSYNETLKTTEYTIAGAVHTGDISVTMKVYGIPFTFSSSSRVCPFGYNTTVNIIGGASLTVNNNLKMLPGCSINVQSDGTLTISSGKSAYFYSVGEGGYDGSYNYRGWCAADAATLTVEEGGQAVCSGTIASTDATFANVGGFTAGTGTATVNEVTQSGTAVTTVPVTFYTYTAA